MKLQTIIMAIATSVIPMAVVAQTQEMFDGYPYCDECASNYEDYDGHWNYANDTWCKVDDKKCYPTTCEPIDGYPCCEDPSSNISYVDLNAEWNNENDELCVIKPLELLHEFYLDPYIWLDTMPRVIREGEEYPAREAYFTFKMGIDIPLFLEKYEFDAIIINGNHINLDSVYYQYETNELRFETAYYIKGDNDIRIVIRKKATDQSYIWAYLVNLKVVA